MKRYEEPVYDSQAMFSVVESIDASQVGWSSSSMLSRDEPLSK